MIADPPENSLIAFPKLDPSEIQLLETMASEQNYSDGEFVFRAGLADLDFLVIKSGRVDILNPSDEDRLIVSHRPGEFIGDIDLLTRRPVIVTAIARGNETVLLRVPGNKLRAVLNMIPRLGEKLITAIQVRRQQLQDGGVLGLKVVGYKHCRDTTIVREFLYKNFVPFTWFDMAEPRGQAMLKTMGSPKKMPAIECGDGKILQNPALLELAQCAWNLARLSHRRGRSHGDWRRSGGNRGGGVRGF